MQRAVFLFAILASLRIDAATVEGKVRFESDAMPGCTIRLRNSDWSWTGRTDGAGHYQFDGVGDGEYEIVFEFEGFFQESQRVLVRGESITLPIQEMTAVEVDGMGSDCWGPHGDVTDDPANWNDLLNRAEEAVRFHDSLDGTQRAAAREALTIVSKDPRARSLMLRVLDTNDEGLVLLAINGLVEQRDLASMPLIESAIDRFPEDSFMRRMMLERYRAMLAP
ncbi:MAG TPA: carboxypeptidase-like regulatory domain-containing protein [Thermoanaerobaculia bacterium]|jgi:hypothetical protein|nr:carboxypeptidase-like regulatory domain-containing protein [Thermoanaerobaculia bacterium]